MDRSFQDCDVLLTGRQTDRLSQDVFDDGFESPQAHRVKREVVDIKDSAQDLLLAYEAMDAWVREGRCRRSLPGRSGTGGLPWLDDLEKLPRLKGVLEKKPDPGLSPRSA